MKSLFIIVFLATTSIVSSLPIPEFSTVGQLGGAPGATGAPAAEPATKSEAGGSITSAAPPAVTVSGAATKVGEPAATSTSPLAAASSVPADRVTSTAPPAATGASGALDQARSEVVQGLQELANTLPQLKNATLTTNNTAVSQLVDQSASNLALAVGGVQSIGNNIKNGLPPNTGSNPQGQVAAALLAINSTMEKMASAATNPETSMLSLIASAQTSTTLALKGAKGVADAQGLSIPGVTSSGNSTTEAGAGAGPPPPPAETGAGASQEKPGSQGATGAGEKGAGQQAQGSAQPFAQEGGFNPLSPNANSQGGASGFNPLAPNAGQNAPQAGGKSQNNGGGALGALTGGALTGLKRN
ncbi:hypothetical protein P7C70_g66, partial [Phenoliferia sp. Uapishka_3]